MSDLEGLARKLAACLSTHGETDWRRSIPLARDVGAGHDPAGSLVDRRDADAGASLQIAVADAAFLRRILLGLIAAAITSGAMTVALWSHSGLASL